MDSEVQEHKFVIKGTMPSLNEYLSAYATNKYKGNSLKQKYESIAVDAIRWDLKGWKTEKPIIIHYKFYEKNKKRDHDNVFCFASKVVQDALQKRLENNEHLVIPNDGWENVLNFTHEFYVDKENPRIEVSIEEC